MNKKVILILVAVLVVLLSAIGVIELFKNGKKDEANNPESNNTSQTGTTATDDLKIDEDTETGIEVDFETGSVIGEVGNKNPSSDKTTSGSEVVGEDNIPSNGNNNNTGNSTGNNQEGTSNGNSDSSVGNNQNGDSNSNTDSDKSDQTPSDPNKQTMDGWTPYHG